MQESVTQYTAALKSGQKYYRDSVAAGQYPYPPALDAFLDASSVSAYTDIGVLDIPMELVKGTKTVGRVAALAGNFMPLLPYDSEFGAKWIRLCDAHLSDEGIRDPIDCYEYMGSFYVAEGNKRVSVMKSYDAVSIPAHITRVVPYWSDTPDIREYYEFIDFSARARTYAVRFEEPGCYAKLLSRLGISPDHEWTEEERRSLYAGLAQLKTALLSMKADASVTSVSKALLLWLEVYPFRQLKELTAAETALRLKDLFADPAEDAGISVKTDPARGEKPVIEKILSVGRTEHVNAAFIYGFRSSVSSWTMAHEKGRSYIEERFGDAIETQTVLCEDKDYLSGIERAIENGANVIFATMPTMADACRAAASAHKNVIFFDCALTNSFAGVNMYYCRMYECKFIAGAVAGAMSHGSDIGYIANYPILGTPASINAFALGARTTNPDAKIYLHWSCTANDPIRSFAEQNIRIISNRDATAPDQAHLSLEWGTYLTDENGRSVPLATPYWNWGKMYEHIIRSIIAGTLKYSFGHSSVNWWGLNSGVTDIRLSDTLPDGVKTLATILKAGLINGSIGPFRTRIVDKDGVLRNDGTHSFSAEEIMKMDWLADNIVGRIPPYEDLLPKSQETVRVLGLYRDSIPTVGKEEIQL